MEAAQPQGQVGDQSGKAQVHGHLQEQVVGVVHQAGGEEEGIEQRLHQVEGTQADAAEGKVLGHVERARPDLLAPGQAGERAAAGEPLAPALQEGGARAPQP